MQVRVQKVGDFRHKGSVGIYLQDVEARPPRYMAVDWGFLPETLFAAIDRKDVVEVSLPDIGWLARIDQCLG